MRIVTAGKNKKTAMTEIEPGNIAQAQHTRNSSSKATYNWENSQAVTTYIHYSRLVCAISIIELLQKMIESSRMRHWEYKKNKFNNCNRENNKSSSFGIIRKMTTYLHYFDLFAPSLWWNHFRLNRKRLKMCTKVNLSSWISNTHIYYTQIFDVVFLCASKKTR